MSALRLVVFDDGMGQFGPLCDLRAACDLRTGASTTLERIERIVGSRAGALIVPPALEALTDERHPDTPVNTPLEADRPTLLVSARCATPQAIRDAAALPPRTAVVTGEGRLVAAHGPIRITHEGLDLPDDLSVHTAPPAALMDRPWDIISHLGANLTDDLDASSLPVYPADEADVHVLGEHPVKVASTARLHPMTVLNVEKGPIVIDRGAIVGSFSVVAGPCYIGPNTIIAPHTHVRSFTSIGPTCVIAGEVCWSVVQGMSNKSHAGYLGYSVVGEWVNFGADTTVSSLKNTYGHVRMKLEADREPEDTGIIKLGSVIGDHVRTAIGTRIMTGACVGTATMLGMSTFVPTFVDRFSFCTDKGIDRYDVDRFIVTTRNAMGRRGRELSPDLEARLRILAGQ